MKKAGKARKAAKQREAAKHRARHRHGRQVKREKHRASAAAQRVYDQAKLIDGAPSPEASKALAFCRLHDLAPRAVLQQLLDGPMIRARVSAHAVDSSEVRDELLRRLSAVVLSGDLSAMQPGGAQAGADPDVLPVL